MFSTSLVQKLVFWHISTLGKMLGVQRTSGILSNTVRTLHTYRHLQRLPIVAAQGQMFKRRSTTLDLQLRNYHISRKDESIVVLGGLALAGTALLGQYAVKAWNARAAEKKAKEAENPTASAEGDAASAGVSSSWFARAFYDGGFEDKMSRREAALILGVRESAAAQRIKEAHRRILLLNHPDTGGSTYLASKINEAKELLLKGNK